MNIDNYRWETPEYYGGFNPVGDIVVYSQNRDSSILEQSNYKQIFKHLKETIKDLDSPPYIEGDERSEFDWVYDFRARHWACDAAIEVIGSMEDYPVFDEMHYSEMQWDATETFWQECSTEDRMHYCKEMGVSIFAARRDYTPESNYDLCDFVDGLN
jgi:hypothetical protein